MVVYLDIIWLLNFLVDSFLLWTTAILLKKSVSLIRILLGGFLGSLLILSAITPLATLATHPISKGVISICMIFIVFGFKRMKQFTTILFTFYFMTFLMGGILLGTHYFLFFQMGESSASIVQNFRGYGDPVSWIFIIAAFPIAWQFSRRRIVGMTISNIQYDMLHEVNVEINEIKFTLLGLVDSGNQLFDPISKMPVMIISVEKLKEILPEEILYLADDQIDLYDAVTSLDSSWSSLMRLIPAKTLGNNQNLLCALKPEYIAISNKSGVKIKKNALIVFTNQILSNDGSFQCIIHPLLASEDVIHTAS
ncbi:sigma-E processing peptidase SpoIIGA [Pseudogracilibacillus auburnensis]|uniref:sigma-E processing peptidase SpoIIGA n=1 Tax=Pseudogracilibacillus auburnensis TaxID=1494959 RepID=UPI001A96A1B1|nr:sigma-E processing peptidase SpoIIGA [Pseudogracilibacillus auburnensis]MBO1004944.1 sigma-E processing peptidase SpoIIGA [Pseudogracilibacillus auburnensis]